jgi:uncharacterized protein (DUF488 family)
VRARELECMSEPVNLRADFPRGTGVTIWTIGHGQEALEPLVQRLLSHGVKRVVDVRSRPYSSWAEHFNGPELERTLPVAGLEYFWLGDKLGQRPAGERFYDADGYTLYDELLKEEWFMKAIGRLEHDADETPLALLCMEEAPERCHRWALIGTLLSRRGAQVLHIRRSGTVQSQQEVDYAEGVAQTTLFDEPQVWRSPEPMEDLATRGKPFPDDDGVDSSPYAT